MESFLKRSSHLEKKDGMNMGSDRLNFTQKEEDE